MIFTFNKNHSGCFSENKQEGCKSGNRETISVAPAVIQVGNAGNLVWAASSDVSMARHKFKRTQ